jgi:hypothetical protein
MPRTDDGGGPTGDGHWPISRHWPPADIRTSLVATAAARPPRPPESIPPATGILIKSAISAR